MLRRRLPIQDFSACHFHGTFRDYQQKILDRAADYLSDRHLHIAAPPGSGKTTLGLELIRRQNRPALVLAPTLAIRDQWLGRFWKDFAPPGTQEDPQEAEHPTASTSLDHPALLTCITYQALFAAWNREKSPEKARIRLVRGIRNAGIGVLCLDEAHHLRREWQRVLELFAAAVRSDVITLALTATPPYDATPGEWQRYLRVCGEIDEEIFTPQLVACGDLCPHQDYVYLVSPTPQEAQRLKQMQEKARECVQSAMQSQFCCRALQTSAIQQPQQLWRMPTLRDVAGFSALLYLAVQEQQQQKASEPWALPVVWAQFAEKAALSFDSLQQAAQTAFSFVLGAQELFSQEICAQLETHLRRFDAMRQGKPCLMPELRDGALLQASAGKLQAVGQIVRREAASLGDELRLLVLTDHVRLEQLGRVGTQEPLDRLGAVPVFEAVRREISAQQPIALMTGSCVLVPHAAVEPLHAIAGQLAQRAQTSAHPERPSDSESPVAEKPLAAALESIVLPEQSATEAAGEVLGHGAPESQPTEHCFTAHPLRETGFDRLEFAPGQGPVMLLTRAFEQGIFHVLVGTRALLGEGWDAPSVNTLVLASAAASFVMTNQMRGRALRNDPTKPQKFSNIWHLAAVEAVADGGPDYQELDRRFSTFLAPDTAGKVICGGLERLGCRPCATPDEAERQNAFMFTAAADRVAGRRAWKNALLKTPHPEVLQQKRVPRPFQPKVVLRGGNPVVCTASFVAFAGMGQLTALLLASGGSLQAVPTALLCVAGGGALVRSAWRAWRASSPKRSMQLMADCTVRTLRICGLLQSTSARAEVTVTPVDDSVCCALRDASTREKTIFASAMEQLLLPVDAPHYLLVRWQKPLGSRETVVAQSFACPTVFAAKAEYAHRFLAELNRAGMPLVLENAYTEAGKEILAKCRAQQGVLSAETLSLSTDYELV